MKKLLALCLVSAMIGVVAYTSYVFGKGDCKVPSSNEKLCYHPEDGVAECAGITEFECNTTRGELRVYSVNSFPDGSVDSDAGHIKEEFHNCWTWRGCGWDAEKKKCTPASDLQTWRTAAKIVVKDSLPCE